MTLPHFFINDQVIADQNADVFALRLSAEDIKHARVLRLAPKEHIAVIDAARDYFECAVVSFDGQNMHVSIAGKGEVADSRAQVILVQGLAKGDKMDSIIRQGTEIGVATFIPFVCQRSVVKFDARKAQSRRERWQSIARSAAMQNAQNAIPQISEVVNLEEVCIFVRQATVVLICWEEERQARLGESLQTALDAQSIAPQDARVVVVVGPEGGLSEEEVCTLRDANPFASTVSLGSSILRTETTGVLAPALVLHELGALA